jgi:hypothetical protein
MLDCRCEHANSLGPGLAPRPEQTLDREVVRFGPAAGEDDRTWANTEYPGDPFTRLLQHPTRGPSGCVQGRRVSYLITLRQPSLSGRRQHRRCRRMIGVDTLHVKTVLSRSAYRSLR